MTDSALKRAWIQRWPSPAKINRFLHIVGRRSDGYHLIQSVFQIVDYCDYLKYSHTNHHSITISNSIESVEDKDNLIIKAAQLLQSHCQIKSGVTISIEKNIPMGAGLGGGSSNAATTLLALNLLWDCQQTPKELSKLALKLGADVPFFIQGKNALVEGIGENITPLKIDCPWLLLAIPDTHISTKDIFTSKNLKRDTHIISIKQLNQLHSNAQQLIPLGNYGSNDCEEVVKIQYPKVNQVFKILEGTSNPRLTGTGSCIFSLFNSKIEANQAIPNKSKQTQFLVKKSLFESPILSVLKNFTNIHSDNHNLR